MLAGLLPLKKLDLKKPTSRLVTLTFLGLEALSLSLLKTEGAVVDNKRKENSEHTHIYIYMWVQTLTDEERNQLFLMQTL